MAHNPFVTQEKAIPNQAREDIVERWLNGATQRQIGRDLNIPKSTIQNIIDNFAERGHSNYKIGGNKIRLARTEDVVTYTAFCKSHSSQAVRLALAMSVVWQFRDTNRESRCRTRHIRTLYWWKVNKTTWSNPLYNAEMFYCSVWVFETLNEPASIYHGRACEREYIQPRSQGLSSYRPLERRGWSIGVSSTQR